MEDNKKNEKEMLPVENVENNESSPLKNEESKDDSKQVHQDQAVETTLEESKEVREENGDKLQTNESENIQKIEDEMVSPLNQQNSDNQRNGENPDQLKEKNVEEEKPIVITEQTEALEREEDHALNINDQNASSHTLAEQQAEKAAADTQKVENENSLSEPVQSSQSPQPSPSEEGKPKVQEPKPDLGLVGSVKAEIRKTPKPKKILVGAITASMVIVGIFGIGTYALDPTPIRAMQKQEVAKSQPAKIQLVLDDKKFELDLKTIGYDGENVSTVDENQLRLWLEEVRKQVDVEPKNADVTYFGQEIKPEQMGRKMDVEKVETWLKNLNLLMNKPHTIPTIPLEPEVTTEDLQKVDQALVGKYTTKFDPGNVNRTINIKLASKSINNLVLLPGEEFSFNKVVGQRTAARGYKSAPVIVKGEYSEGIGGGICQVSSTLYNSVDEAGLKITRRVSHSREVTYVPPGRDATVSWGGPDFRFKNNLDKPVLIKIKVSGPYLTVYTYTVPGAKVKKKKVEPAPQTFTTVTVDPTKPTADLSKESNAAQ